MNECYFCGKHVYDVWEFEGEVLCGTCIMDVEILEAFILHGGTRDLLFVKSDGQMMMEI